MAEKAITNAIIAAYRKRGAFIEKIHATGYQRRGLPDLIAGYRGKFIGIETKQPKNKNGVTPAQSEVLLEIVEAGCWGVSVTSLHDALLILDFIDLTEPQPKKGHGEISIESMIALANKLQSEH